MGWSNYGARFYDPAIARFTTIDPLTEEFPWQSGYVYADNDPVGKIDFMGMSGESMGQGIDEFEKVFKHTEKTINPMNENYLADLDPSKHSVNHTFSKDSPNVISNKAHTVGMNISAVGIGGLSFELGIATDSYGETAPYFRLGGDLGISAGFGVVIQEMTSDSPITLSMIEGKDVEYNIDLVIASYTYGGDQGSLKESRPRGEYGGADSFTNFGDNYITKGIGSEVDKNTIRKMLKSKKAKKTGFKPGATASFGTTWLLNKKK